MGGYGSGRPNIYGRGKVEHCRAIDVNRLHKEGCLKPGWRGNWEWKHDDERVAWIGLKGGEDRITLSYRYRRNDSDWQDVEQTVLLVRVACRYGGSRPYFICPGVLNGHACGRRVVKLYGAERYFLCRHCYRLAYASQSEATWDRALRRADKIRQQLGGDPGMSSIFPERPKGMWRRTYERLRDDAFEAEMLADQAFLFHAERLLARIDGAKLRGSS